MKIFFIALVFVAAAAAAACILITWFLFNASFMRAKNTDKDKTAFFARMEKGPFADKANRIKEGMAWAASREYTNLQILSYDGLNLCARFLPAENFNGRIMVLMHGYHSFPEFDFSCVLSLYHSLGYDILMPDQRAHGKSDGEYICFGARERHDTAFWCRLMAERYPDKKIVLGGISMGSTSVLLGAALPEMPDNLIGIIADCGFTSPYEEFSHVIKDGMHLPKFPFLFLAEKMAKRRAGFTFSECSTIDAVAKISVPILFIHGEADTFVLPENSMRNFAACTAPKELILVPGAEHGMSFLVDEKGCTDKLLKFLDRL